MSWVNDPDDELWVGGTFKKPVRDPIKGFFGDTIKPGDAVVYITGGSGVCINAGIFLGVIRRLPPKSPGNENFKIEEYVIQLSDKSRTRLHYNRIFPASIQLSDLCGVRFY